MLLRLMAMIIIKTVVVITSGNSSKNKEEGIKLAEILVGRTQSLSPLASFFLFISLSFQHHSLFFLMIV